MADKIEIRLFDGFGIYRNGKEILENLANTRKTKMFVAYLLANRERAVTHQELFELLWSGEEYANPATALRTLLYRFRNMIAQEGVEQLSNAIISKRGTYQWNNDLKVSIDALEFLELAAKGLDKKETRNNRKAYLSAAVNLYRGSLLPDFCSEPWLIIKSSAYRDKYIEVVDVLISILKEENQYPIIATLCKNAQTLAGKSELLELEEAIAKVRIVNPNSVNEFAEEEYYRQIKLISSSVSARTEDIKAELEEDAVEQQAYLCDYNVFKEIYRLQRRLQSRSKATIFLGILDLTSDREDMKSMMPSAIKCFQKQLRCGDAICHIDGTRAAVLFPAESYESAMGVLERLKEAVKVRLDEDMIVVYRVCPLKNAKE